MTPNPQQALKHLFPTKATTFSSQLIHNGSAADWESLKLLTNTGNSHKTDLDEIIGLSVTVPAEDSFTTKANTIEDLPI